MVRKKLEKSCLTVLTPACFSRRGRGCMCGCKHHVKIASKHAQHQHSSASPRHTRCMCSISHWHLSAQIFIVLCCQNQHETIGATPVAFYAVVSCDIRMCYDALSALFEAPRSQLSGFHQARLSLQVAVLQSWTPKKTMMTLDEQPNSVKSRIPHKLTLFHLVCSQVVYCT